MNIAKLPPNRTRLLLIVVGMCGGMYNQNLNDAKLASLRILIIQDGVQESRLYM